MRNLLFLLVMGRYPHSYFAAGMEGAKRREGRETGKKRREELGDERIRKVKTRREVYGKVLPQILS